MAIHVDDQELVMIERVVVRRGTYYDPITLMQVSEEVRAGDGVSHVAVGMGDRLNLFIIGVRHDYDLNGESNLGPNDLVIGVRAETEEIAEKAVSTIERRLAERGGQREVVEVGPFVFAGERGGQETLERIEWRPPQASGDGGSGNGDLAKLAPHAERIAQANDLAVARMQEARPIVVGIGTAGEVLPEMTPRTFLHAGPPIEWADMSGPMRGAIIGAALLEGLAADAEEVVRRAEAGEFEFAPGHERGALGPMCGVISHSMPVWIVENDAHGNRAHCNFSEGLGKVLRFGAYDQEVVDNLRWLGAVVAPVFKTALEHLAEPLDLRAICADAVEMGDEVHNRNRAGTSLLLRAIAPALVAIEERSQDVADVTRWIAGNDYFFLNLSMASGKATADAAAGIEHSTIVTTMARNGTEFGLRVSGTGDRWFTAPSSTIRGLYLPGHHPEEANPDVGDSTITETIGLGGFAMAASPRIIHFAGISPDDAIRATLTMYEITWAESINYRIPALGFRGSPLGIDCRKVVETGILPVADTGVAHRKAGVGTIGGGVVRPPMAVFTAAVEALSDAASR
jgi:uncharacterized protein DUF1116